MDNYKIKVKDEAESKEAQELFFELGFKWHGCGKYYNRIGNYTFITAYSDEMLLRMGWGGDTDKELSLPQLRDLVVLKRGDVRDATHNNFRTNTPYLKQGENEYYMLDGEWVLSNCPNDLEPINKPQDPALISGAEALRALADGKEVEYEIESKKEWRDITNDPWDLNIILNGTYGHKFRLKPQTIKVELELPKPFEPKAGEKYWYVKPTEENGYDWALFYDNSCDFNKFGAWATEPEVKQVVEQLRKIRGTNS